MAELFARYEVNRAPIWPILSKVLVGSLAFHLLFGLTMNYVPVARAIFGISRNAFGTEIVDEDYQRTIVKDDVTMLLAGGKFQYPEGYFAKESSSLLPVTAPPVPVVVATPVPLPPVAKLPTPLPLPKGSKDGAKDGSSAGLSLPPVPLPPLEVAKNQPTPLPKATPTPLNKEEQAKKDADKTIDEVAKQHNIARPRRDQINMRPVKEAFTRINAVKAQQPINLDANAEVIYTAQRTPEFRLTNVILISRKGDEAVIGVISELVAAFGDSGAAQFLPEAQKYTATLTFNGPTVTAIIDAETPSPETARSLASAYGLMLKAAQVKQKDAPEGVFLNNAKVSVSGKSVVFTCIVPREATNGLINENLASNPAPTSPAQTP